MEWDDYLRQQAATYRQLAEKAEDAVVKKELLDLANVCEEVANNIEDRLTSGLNGLSRFRTWLEGLDFKPASEEANRRSQRRSARRQRKHCAGALTGEAHSRRTLAIAILVWLEAL